MARKKSPILTNNQKELRKSLSSDKIDIVFICAVNDEYTRFLEHLTYSGITYVNSPKLNRLHDCDYQRFVLAVAGEQLQCIVVRQEFAGMVACANICARGLRYSPRLVAMSGICGGVPGKVNRGDLVCVHTTYDYGAGKYKNDGTFVANPDQRHPNNRSRAAYKEAIDQFEDICNSCDPSVFSITTSTGETSTKCHDAITIHRGVMGTGAAVVNCKALIDKVIERQKDMIAYDMEAYSLGYMCDRAPITETPWLVVKGVQDLADTKPEHKDEYNRLTSYLSAAFVIEAAKQFFLLDFEE